MPLIDTLRLKTNLELAGMDERPAAAIADALDVECSTLNILGFIE